MHSMKSAHESEDDQGSSASAKEDNDLEAGESKEEEIEKPAPAEITQEEDEGEKVYITEDHAENETGCHVDEASRSTPSGLPSPVFNEKENEPTSNHGDLTTKLLNDGGGGDKEEEAKEDGEATEDENQEDGDLPKDIYSLLYFVTPVVIEKEAISKSGRIVITGEIRDSKNDDLDFQWKIVAYVIAIFAMQILMLLLVMFNLLDYDKSLPLFNPPADVTRVVRLAQYFAIPIAVWTQDDFIESFDIFHFNKDKCHKVWLYLAWLMKLVVGGIGLVISLFIVIQSDKVIDLFANFAAMAFISQVDNLIFFLILNGYSFSFLQKRVKKVSKVKMEEDDNNSCWNENRQCGFSFAKLFASHCFILTVIVLWIPLIIVNSAQQGGDYLPTSIDVYVGDDLGDLSVIFRNGEFKSINRRRKNGRYVYYEADLVDSCKDGTGDVDETCVKEKSTTRVEYNGIRRIWTYVVLDKFIQAESERTDTFDVESVSEWKVWQWSEIHSRSTEFTTSTSFTVKSNKCVELDDCGGNYEDICNRETFTCDCKTGSLGPMCRGPPPCQLEVDIGRSFPDYDRSFMFLEQDDNPFLFKGRPVFYSQESGTENFNAIFFIGNRWILTNRYNIMGDTEGNIFHFISRLKEIKGNLFQDVYYDCGNANFCWKGDYVSQETFGYSPAGLSWNRLVYNIHTNEKQEDGLFGQLEPVDSVLLCKTCEWFHEQDEYWDNCINGYCGGNYYTEGYYGNYYNKDYYYNNTNDGLCVCFDGWYGSKCHIPDVRSKAVEFILDYEDTGTSASSCLKSAPFNPLPLRFWNKTNFEYDLIPPIPFKNEKSIGIFISKRKSSLAIYESSCQLKRTKLLRKVPLNNHNGTNNYMDLVLKEHDDLIEINGTGAYLISKEMVKDNDYCENNDNFSTALPKYMRHAHGFESSMNCSAKWNAVYEEQDDPLLKDLTRILVSLQFQVLSEIKTKKKMETARQ